MHRPSNAIWTGASETARGRAQRSQSSWPWRSLMSEQLHLFKHAAAVRQTRNNALSNISVLRQTCMIGARPERSERRRDEALLAAAAQHLQSGKRKLARVHACTKGMCAWVHISKLRQTCTDARAWMPAAEIGNASTCAYELKCVEMASQERWNGTCRREWKVDERGKRKWRMHV
eukprot:1179966-Pleurochrysis_carterae.AAC.1